mmetsp:Transcript_66059/g.132554  ORF Transcript_66059/g.132554 Transcript_66059/m.132554 type:complete len:234 (-) Transcript_66059:137-838(-)
MSKVGRPLGPRRAPPCAAVLRRRRARGSGLVGRLCPLRRSIRPTALRALGSAAGKGQWVGGGQVDVGKPSRRSPFQECRQLVRCKGRCEVTLHGVKKELLALQELLVEQQHHVAAGGLRHHEGVHGALWNLQHVVEDVVRSKAQWRRGLDPEARRKHFVVNDRLHQRTHEEEPVLQGTAARRHLEEQVLGLPLADELLEGCSPQILAVDLASWRQGVPDGLVDNAPIFQLSKE